MDGFDRSLPWGLWGPSWGLIIKTQTPVQCKSVSLLALGQSPELAIQNGPDSPATVVLPLSPCSALCQFQPQAPFIVTQNASLEVSFYKPKFLI